jgi:hypothetical protein
MLSNISRLQVQIGTKMYTLLCDVDSPLADVKEAVFQFQKYVGQIEDQVKEMQRQKAEEEEKAKLEKVENVVNAS